MVLIIPSRSLHGKKKKSTAVCRRRLGHFDFSIQENSPCLQALMGTLYTNSKMSRSYGSDVLLLLLGDKRYRTEFGERTNGCCFYSKERLSTPTHFSQLFFLARTKNSFLRYTFFFLIKIREKNIMQFF